MWVKAFCQKDHGFRTDTAALRNRVEFNVVEYRRSPCGSRAVGRRIDRPARVEWARRLASGESSLCPPAEKKTQVECFLLLSLGREDRRWDTLGSSSPLGRSVPEKSVSFTELQTSHPSCVDLKRTLVLAVFAPGESRGGGLEGKEAEHVLNV